MTARRQQGFGSGKAVLWAVIAGVTLAACQKDVILQGTRFPVRAPLDASIPVDGQPDPVAPPDRPDNLSAPISLPEKADPFRSVL